MYNFLFECPILGLMVQGTLETQPALEEGTRISYECPACARIHIVDPRGQRPTDLSKNDEP
jgi:hypothetical protein